MTPTPDEAPSNRGLLPQFAAYARSFAAYGGRGLAAAAALVGIGALVEGVGIVLIIPLLALLFNGAGVGPAAPLLALLHAIGATNRADQLNAMLAGFAILLVLRNLVVWQRDTRVSALSQGFVDYWRDRIVHALAGASWPMVLSVQRSELEFAITSDVGRLAIGTDRILRGSVSAIMLVVQLGIALWLSPVLMLIVFALLAGLTATLRPIVRASHRHGVKLTEDGRSRHMVLTDFISGMKLAKAHNAEARYADEFTRISDRLRARALSFSRLQAGGSALFQTVSGLLACAIVLIGIHVTHTPVAVLSALLVLMTRLSAPLMQLVQGMQALAGMIPAFVSLRTLEDRLRESHEAPAVRPPAAAMPAAGPARIVLDGLAFRHQGAERDLLREASLEIGAGELAVLLGPSGTGKTTIADLMTGLLRPDAGRLLVDGRAIDGEAAADWRRQVAYVPQDPFLFDRPLHENLRWGAPEADEAALWQALEAVEAADFVRSLPDGLGTRMAERGARLSGGERQRICLARALLRRPRLLILDEATNALDRATEARLLGTLDRIRTGLTIFMITHRLHEELAVDRVYTLAQGRIIETGPLRGQGLS